MINGTAASCRKNVYGGENRQLKPCKRVLDFSVRWPDTEHSRPLPHRRFSDGVTTNCSSQCFHFR